MPVDGSLVGDSITTSPPVFLEESASQWLIWNSRYPTASAVTPVRAARAAAAPWVVPAAVAWTVDADAADAREPEAKARHDDRRAAAPAAEERRRCIAADLLVGTGTEGNTQASATQDDDGEMIDSSAILLFDRSTVGPMMTRCLLCEQRYLVRPAYLSHNY